MRGELRTRLLAPLAAALLLAVLVPAAAEADSHTFLNTDDLYPSGGAGTSGPANEYPSRIVVSGSRARSRGRR